MKLSDVTPKIFRITQDWEWGVEPLNWQAGCVLVKQVPYQRSGR